MYRFIAAVLCVFPIVALAADPPTPPPAQDMAAVADYWHRKADQNGQEAANIYGMAATLQAQVKALTEENAKLKADKTPHPPEAEKSQ